MCSLVLFLITPMMIAGFDPLSLTYSLKRSLLVRSEIILSATIRESESFHRPLRLISVPGSTRVTDREHEQTISKIKRDRLRFISTFFLIRDSGFSITNH